MIEAFNSAAHYLALEYNRTLRLRDEMHVQTRQHLDAGRVQDALDTERQAMILDGEVRGLNKGMTQLAMVRGATCE